MVAEGVVEVSCGPFGRVGTGLVVDDKVAGGGSAADDVDAVGGGEAREFTDDGGAAEFGGEVSAGPVAVAVVGDEEEAVGGDDGDV